MKYETSQSGPLNQPIWSATVFGKCCCLTNIVGSTYDILVDEIQYGSGTGKTKAESMEAAALAALESMVEYGV